MPRPLLLAATAALAALTALALVAAALAIRPPPPVALSNPAEGAIRAAVYRFYDAVNAAITTGDTEPLAAVLAPDYVERGADGVASPGRAALERSLRALHDAMPGLRLEPEALIAAGDRVVALVRAHGGDEAVFLGLALDGWTAWGQVDVFQVADGRVAERVSSDERRPLLERQARLPIDLPPPAERVLTVQRLTLAPGGSRRAPEVDGLRALYLEAGALAVEVKGTVKPPPNPPPLGGPGPPLPATVDLVAGDHRVLPDGAAYAARNLGREPAVLLEVLVGASAALPGTAAPSAMDTTTQVLAGGQAVAVATGSAALAIGRATLAPGARLAWPGTPGPVLLVVEAGTLGLATDGEKSAWVRSAADGQAHYRGLAMLGTGEGALVGAWTGVEVRNAGEAPLVLLVVTLVAS